MFAVLETERLLLRPPRARDIGQLVPLIRDFDVAKNLSRVPHPYTEDDACDFMIKASVGWVSGEDWPFSIVRKADGQFIGMGGLHPARGWEIGYWIGRPYWGCGYATEAAARLVEFAFDQKGAERLKASWFHDNPASGRVLEKLGFRPKGGELINSIARGFQVAAHVVALDRDAYRARKRAA